MAEYYRHFKGKVYRLVSVAKDSDTLDKIVVYQAMYDDGDIWVRPYDEFFGKVDRDGMVRDRFTKIGEKEALDHAPLYLHPKYHFPDIEYQAETPTMLNPEAGFSRGVKAMVSLLLRRNLVDESFFDGLFNDDDIEKEAIRQIKSYHPGEDPKNIFHLIQAWGGNSGRGIYLHGEGSIKGAFFHKGQKLSDGTIVETDMIVLYSVDNAQEVLWEESLHQWQYHNNILNGARQTSTIVACEEVQADIIQALVGYAEGTRWTSITGRAASDSGFREMAERAFNKETGFYDTDIIMEYINSSQGIITDKDWNYNWECVLNMFVGQPFSQTNGNNGY